jgi:hypothetical protein
MINVPCFFQLERLSVGAIFVLWGRTCSRFPILTVWPDLPGPSRDRLLGDFGHFGYTFRRNHIYKCHGRSCSYDHRAKLGNFKSLLHILGSDLKMQQNKVVRIQDASWKQAVAVLLKHCITVGRTWRHQYCDVMIDIISIHSNRTNTTRGRGPRFLVRLMRHYITCTHSVITGNGTR